MNIDTKLCPLRKITQPFTYSVARTNRFVNITQPLNFGIYFLSRILSLSPLPLSLSLTLTISLCIPSFSISVCLSSIYLIIYLFIHLSIFLLEIYLSIYNFPQVRTYLSLFLFTTSVLYCVHNV